MRYAVESSLTGDIVEHFAVLDVDELSRLCAVDRIHIVELVEEGVLSIMQAEATEWRFAGTALQRARTALRLQRDLEINLPGVALALQLMDELERLRGALPVDIR